MFMRMVHVRVKHEALSRVKHLYADRIIPALATVPGCRYAGLLQSARRPDECVSLTLWDGQEFAEAYEQGGLFGILLEEVRPFLIDSSESHLELSEDLTLQYVSLPEQPVITTFPVAASGTGTGAKSGSRPVWVRLVSLKLKPGAWEEFKTHYEQEVIPALRKVKGSRYIYLSHRNDHPDEIISLTTWESREDAEAYEKSGVFASLLDKQQHMLSDLYRWKRGRERTEHGHIATSDDAMIEQFDVLAARSYP